MLSSNLESRSTFQVTKMGKWDDVASASNSKSCVSMPAAQLQNVYKMLILQYELMYFHRMPVQANTWPDKTSQGSNTSPSDVFFNVFG